jgi:hypothetical protein
LKGEIWIISSLNPTKNRMSAPASRNWKVGKYTVFKNSRNERINPIKMAIPPRLGMDFLCEVLGPGSATRNFFRAISTMEGIRKNVIPPAKEKHNRIRRSIVVRWNIIHEFRANVMFFFKSDEFVSGEW